MEEFDSVKFNLYQSVHQSRQTNTQPLSVTTWQNNLFTAASSIRLAWLTNGKKIYTHLPCKRHQPLITSTSTIFEENGKRKRD